MNEEVIGPYSFHSEYISAKKRLGDISLPYIIFQEALSSFLAGMNGTYIGNTMEVIESLGLTEKQEGAVKRILKAKMYEIMIDCQNSIHAEVDLFIDDLPGCVNCKDKKVEYCKECAKSDNCVE